MSEHPSQRITLTPKQVANRLSVAVQTLQSWRDRKVGPPYYRLVGKIIYHQHEVDEWFDQTKWG